MKSLDLGNNKNVLNDFFQFNDNKQLQTVKQNQPFNIEKIVPIFSEKIILSLINNQITSADFKG